LGAICRFRFVGRVLGISLIEIFGVSLGFFMLKKVAPPWIEGSWALATPIECDGKQRSPSAYPSCSHGLQIHVSPSRPANIRPLTRYQSVVDQFYGRTLVITLKCPSESGVYEVLKKFKDLLFVKVLLGSKRLFDSDSLCLDGTSPVKETTAKGRGAGAC
jgi:hypothetical protein